MKKTGIVISAVLMLLLTWVSGQQGNKAAVSGRLVLIDSIESPSLAKYNLIENESVSIDNRTRDIIRNPEDIRSATVRYHGQKWIGEWTGTFSRLWYRSDTDEFRGKDEEGKTFTFVLDRRSKELVAFLKSPRMVSPDQRVTKEQCLENAVLELDALVGDTSDYELVYTRTGTGFYRFSFQKKLNGVPTVTWATVNVYYDGIIMGHSFCAKHAMDGLTAFPEYKELLRQALLEAEDTLYQDAAGYTRETEVTSVEAGRLQDGSLALLVRVTTFLFDSEGKQAYEDGAMYLFYLE